MTENDHRERGKSVVTTVRLPPDQHDRLREIAASQDRSMAYEIRRLIAERIAAHDET